MVSAAFAGVPAWAAQGAPAPPGPYVIDVRGVSSGLPQDAGFFPPTAGEATGPSRGAGFDVGAHVYAGRLRGASLGFGASLLKVRGEAVSTSPDASTTASGTPTGPPGVRLDLWTIAPQVSFNFGTEDGWSYLSGGVGMTGITTRTLDLEEATRESGMLIAINAGAGARWFLVRRFAVGFDLRLHRVAAADTTPASILFAISGGFSLR
jgi:hypothetical protein